MSDPLAHFLLGRMLDGDAAYSGCAERGVDLRRQPHSRGRAQVLAYHASLSLGRGPTVADLPTFPGDLSLGWLVFGANSQSGLSHDKDQVKQASANACSFGCGGIDRVRCSAMISLRLPQESV